jgi:hypothetical protein
MRISLLIVLVLLISGCASMTYNQAPDGNIKVTYWRLFTGSDSIKGQLNKETKISVTGQKSIDPATLETIINILGAVK